MFEQWLVANAPIISTTTVSLCSAIAALVTLIKTINAGKANKNQYDYLKEQISVTKEGIVEAFKNAKFPTNWRVDLSKKVEVKFEELSNKLYKRLAASEAARTKLMIYIAKIISNTAAYNKLSAEEQADLTALLTVINEIEIDE